MGQQNKGGFGTANPVPYFPQNVDIKDPVDTNPSDKQPPGVDDEIDYNSLEEALLGES
tara:strand:- start:43 stop:216 length:174 start_codon:yes stop_codon:yes gene_type:complete